MMFRSKIKLCIRCAPICVSCFTFVYIVGNMQIDTKANKTEINELVYIHTPNKLLCAAKRILIIIKSSITEFEERRAIRKTWGKRASQLGVTYFFSVGNNTDDKTYESMQIILNDEIETFNDILQTNVPENYHFLTLKTYANFLWFVNECSAIVEYVFFVDCDVIVFPEHLIGYVDGHVIKNNNDSTVYGFCYESEQYVRRNSKNKYYVPRWIWPADRYPPFCSGSAYLMTSRVARNILTAVPGGMRNWRWAAGMDLIDDVIFSGYLRDLASVQLTNSRQHFRVYVLETFDLSTNVCAQLNATVSIHGFRPVSRFHECWTEFRSTINKCSRNKNYTTKHPVCYEDV